MSASNFWAERATNAKFRNKSTYTM
jgi:hypothetical protein